MPSIAQRSFRRGEIAPEFYGASETPEYAQGLRTCKNFLPIQHGALKNRPGTQLDAAIKTAGSPPVLRAFVFSDTQTMVLEFGAGYVRFHTKGGVVLNGGVPYEVATPYLQADLAFLKFSQAGDVITITRVGYAPQDLSRLSNTNWTLGASSLSPVAYFANQPTVSNFDGLGFPVLSAAVSAAAYSAGTTYDYGAFAIDNDNHMYRSRVTLNLNHKPSTDGGVRWQDVSWTGGGIFTQGAYTWNPTDSKMYISLADSNTNHQPDVSAAWWGVALDAAHPARSWQWLATFLWKDSNGVTRETLGSLPTPPTNLALSVDRPAGVFVGAVPGPPGFFYVLVAVNLYRGRSGLFGLVNSIASNGAGTFFNDDGTAPNYAIQPPRGTDPFVVADGNGTANTHKYPAVVAHHEQRRIYARQDSRPNHFIGSKQDDYTNFDVNFPVQDTDSYDFGIGSNRLAEIRSMLSLRRLLLFTGEAVYSAEGAPGSTIKPTSVQVRRGNGEYGASYLQPFGVNEVALYVTAKGNYVRDVIYDWRSDSLISSDLSVMARHLLDNHTVVDWCYAATPWATVWAVRDDGLLLSLTYDRATASIAWAQHPTAGTVLSVCSVPEGNEDAVYLVVTRANGTYVERMASRILPNKADGTPDARYGIFLDCAVQFDGHNLLATTMLVTGGVAWVAGEIVNVASSLAAFAATDVGDRVVLVPDGQSVLNADGTVNRVLTPVAITVTGFTNNQQITGRLEANLDVLYQGVATAAWGWARTNFTGLGHLEGLSVTVLADGAVQGPFVVVQGAVALAPPAAVVIVGLPYTSDMELLDVAAPNERTSVESTERVVFEVATSRGFWTGESFPPATKQPTDKLVQWSQRQVSDSFGAPALFTGQVPVPIRSAWNTNGRAVVRQIDPLPLTILSVTREVTFGGKGT